jgi:hypothetical protein
MCRVKSRAGASYAFYWGLHNEFAIESNTRVEISVVFV